MSDETDAKVLNDVQERFEVNISELPDEIDISSYSKSPYHLEFIDNWEDVFGNVNNLHLAKKCPAYVYLPI